LIRVLIVDDSAVTRAMLRDALSLASDIQVVGEAGDPYEAREQIVRLQPHVVTLDLEMPRMDGLSFLSRLMQHYPLPVVVVSSLGRSQTEVALRALALGAVEVIAKPSRQHAMAAMREPLLLAVRTAAAANVSAPDRFDYEPAAGFSSQASRPRLIAIGASTGGPAAIERVLGAMPANAPPIVIVQHMLAGFSTAFARRLDQRCALRIKEVEDGEVLRDGTALIAPGGRHVVVTSRNGELRAGLRDGPPIHYQRPAVDVLFHSVARALGPGAVGVQLTGMGADGASGLRAMRDAGAHTIAQDERTSVVFSMPNEAIACGGACEVLPLPGIADAALREMSVR
jgi:two-component system, chemotaxis family, protein-glutamate methylesterase/glutaminase